MVAVPLRWPAFGSEQGSSNIRAGGITIERPSGRLQRDVTPREILMKPDRAFHVTAAALNLVIMFVGFSAFYTTGHGEGGRVIAPEIMAVVIVHGMSVTAWYFLSLVQALLITVKNRKLHMTLGWSAARPGRSGCGCPLRPVRD